jgi:hypothetical protein
MGIALVDGLEACETLLVGFGIFAPCLGVVFVGAFAGAALATLLVLTLVPDRVLDWMGFLELLAGMKILRISKTGAFNKPNQRTVYVALPERRKNCF